MKKRVHEIAKEQGMSPKVALARMQAAGMKVGAASSSVDEETALRALGNGGAQPAPASGPNGGATPAGSGGPNGGAKATGRGQPASQTGAKGEGATHAAARPAEAATPAAAAPARTSAPTPENAESAGDGAAPTGAPKAEGEQGYKRPTRDSLQGERAPGAAGGRRRVVIDSQASRRAPGGGPQQQPPRRQRRGRRRRGV